MGISFVLVSLGRSLFEGGGRVEEGGGSKSPPPVSPAGCSSPKPQTVAPFNSEAPPFAQKEQRGNVYYFVSLVRVVSRPGTFLASRSHGAPGLKL